MRIQGRPAYLAGAVVGIPTAVAIVTVAALTRHPNSGFTGAMLFLLPAVSGILAAWFAIRRSPILLRAPATEGILAGAIAVVLGAVAVIVLLAIVPSLDRSGLLGGGWPVLPLAIIGGVAGMFAGDRFAVRRWPELREIRRAQSSTQAEALRALASAPDYAKFAYAQASVSGGQVSLRCPECGSQWSMDARLEAIDSNRVIRSAQRVGALPMSPGLRWTLAIVAVALLGLGAWPLSVALGALVLPISPLAPLGDYLFGRKLPVFLVACGACGKHVALLSGGGTLLVSKTTVPVPQATAAS